MGAFGGLLVLFSAIAMTASAASRSTVVMNESLADKVNIFMGTGNEGPSLSRGNQYPAVHTPFGMAAWSVGSAGLQESWFYDYKDTQLTGIKLTHQPTVWGGDYGALDFMPMTGQPVADYVARRSPYRRQNEVAHPYYYRNVLDKYGVTFELAPSDRGAIFRFAYPKRSEATLVLNGAEAGSAQVSQRSERRIEGRIANGGAETFFVAEFDQPIHALTRNPQMVAALGFGAAETVTMKIATSYISIQQASDNLTLELAGQTLESLRDQTKQKWESALGRVRVTGGKPADQIIFYSTLYRVFAFPKMHWEPVGRDTKRAQYRSPYDDKTHLDGKLWSGNGFWDTYRAFWPLLTLLYPQQTGEMLDGWVNSYKDGGWTVRWSKPGYWESMIGTHTDLIFADAYLKGIRNWDYQEGYESALKNAMVVTNEPGRGRRYLNRSVFIGYIPTGAPLNADQAGSRTFEDSVNDFGISLFASALGKTDEARYFRNRSLGYVKLWDPATKFFRAKDDRGATADGAFDPFVWGYAWTEGDLWHYRFAPMQDGAGLAALFGGRQGMEKGLDEILGADPHFEVGGYGGVIHEMTEAQMVGQRGFGQFAIGNEPIHHLLHLYAYAGRPSKTQYWVRRSLSELYVPGTTDGYGYPGDEDEGEMSAWYVMNAMGFYSAAPGTGEYIMGSPLFETVTLNLENGRQFTIRARGNDEKHVYIASASLNGKSYDKPYLTHAAILDGGTLDLAMSDSASHWGEDVSAMPSSLTKFGETPRYRASLTVGAQTTATALIDTDSLTKWQAKGSKATFEIDLKEPAAANCYTLTSAADEPTKDPKAWTLSGSTDGVHWQTLDQKTGVVWANRLETKLFCFAKAPAYSHYRVDIDENAGGNGIQLAEFELRDLD